MFLILFSILLEGYFLWNRTVFDSADKLFASFQHGLFMSEEMLDIIILIHLEGVSEILFYNFVFGQKQYKVI